MYRNRPIPLYLRVLYWFFRTLARAGILVFYRRRALLGREHLRFDGPAIVIVNHPSTLLDVLNPGIYVRQEMYFLANYGLFKNPVSNWIFRRLYCIPVKRREDVVEGEKRDNDAAFEASYRHLEQGGVLFIAPEGTSYVERVVREFKTGAARIACGAEARNDWKLDVKIVPFGVTYSAPHEFRSDVVVAAGAPVYARDWAEAWETDPATAADDLTAELRRRVQALTVDAGSVAGDRFLARLEAMLRHHDPRPLAEEFKRAQTLAKRVLDDAELQERVERYDAAVKTARLTERGLAAWQKRGFTAWEPVFLLAALPLALAGFLLWVVPCGLPWLLDRRLRLYVGYSSTVRILAGFLTFPAAVVAFYRLAPWWGLSTGLGAVLLAIALGLFAERYYDVWQRFSARRAVQRAPAERTRPLLEARAEILEKIIAMRTVREKAPG